MSRWGGAPSGAAVTCAGIARASFLWPLLSLSPRPIEEQLLQSPSSMPTWTWAPMLVRCDVRRRIVFSLDDMVTSVPTHWQLPKLPRRTRTALLLGCFVSICFGLLAIGVVTIRGVEARLWLHS